MYNVFMEELNMSDKITISATVLITGLVVVFAVLFLLIFILKAYGKIFVSLDTKNNNKTNASQPTSNAGTQAIAQPTQLGAPNEVIAVIAAAVASMYGQNAKIKSVKRISKPERNVWFTAGVLNNTRPF